MNRKDIQPGQIFALNGEVFRRVGSEVRDFGGAVGKCLRAHRQTLGPTFMPTAAGDAEWVQIKGGCTAYSGADEAAMALERAAEKAAEGSHA